MFKSFAALLALTVAAVRAADPYGIDVSDYQTDIDWATVKANGIAWAYIKATEGTDYTSPEFSSQYEGAYDEGIIRGAYHFANPTAGGGSAQATFFAENGGAWSADGLTLPGAIDLESGTSEGSSECWGLSESEMVTFISDFSSTYFSKTTRYPVIYTTTSWWESCTGNTADFASNSPLWIADWASSVGSLPAGWDYYTFWQYDDEGANPGDADLFNGSSADLTKMATG